MANAYAITGDQSYSARVAGYADVSGVTHALKRPAVQAEILRVHLQALHEQVLPLALKKHVALLQDPHTPAGAAVQAIKLAYDRTLGAPEGAETKAPHEMTAEEIQRELAAERVRIAALERAKADQARLVIDGETVDPAALFE